MGPGAEIGAWAPILTRSAVISAFDEISASYLRLAISRPAADPIMVQGEGAAPAIARRLHAKQATMTKPTIGVHASYVDCLQGGSGSHWRAIAAGIDGAVNAIGTAVECVFMTGGARDESQEAQDIEAVKNILVPQDKARGFSLEYSNISLVRELSVDQLGFPFSFVISCSYHVAYTALAAGIRTLIVTGDAKGDQWAQSLRQTFGTLAVHVREEEDVSAIVSRLSQERIQLRPSLFADWNTLMNVRERMHREIYAVMHRREAQQQQQLLAEYRECVLAVAELKNLLSGWKNIRPD